MSGFLTKYLIDPFEESYHHLYDITNFEIDIALGCIENIGEIHQFNQFRVDNKYLKLVEAIEEYSFIYYNQSIVETNLAGSISLPTSQ